VVQIHPPQPTFSIGYKESAVPETPKNQAGLHLGRGSFASANLGMAGFGTICTTLLFASLLLAGIACPYTLIVV